MGKVDNSRIRTTPIRNAGFVSFFSESGCVSPRHADYHDNRLRRQKRLRGLFFLLAAAAVTWIIVESARALPLF